MTHSDIVQQRLVNQQIAGTTFSKPDEIVSWMVAMQAQEYAQAKWAIGLRLPGVKDDDVEKAFTDGLILRTHLLRPTWHFVAAPDIRWLLALTAPRVEAVNKFMYRQCGLEPVLFRRSNDTIAKALEGGKHLTRIDLKSALEQVGIIADGFRLSYLMMQAELDGLICSGPRKGKQFTYALLEERVPKVKVMEPKEALSAFTQRYFDSRGPATIQDFVTWSGLTVKDARIGIEGLPARFIRALLDGHEYIFSPSPKTSDLSVFQSTFLMPNYDEYGMGYKNRSAIFGDKNLGNNPIFNHMLIIDGRIAGTWRRTEKNYSDAETSSFSSLSEAQQQAVSNTVQRYRTFMGIE